MSLAIRALVCGAAFLALAPLSTTVAADEALYLGWDQCGPSGPAQRTFACNQNTGEERLYCAFSLAQALDQVVGVEIVVDLSHASSSLPSWWQAAVGGCRFGAVSGSGGAPDGADCADFWQGQQTGGLQGYAVGQPRGGANQARIKVALSLLAQDARTLQAGTIYYAGRIALGNQNTTGTGACPGCGLDACLVLNSIWIKRLPGAPGGDVFLTTPAPGGGNQATWQGTGADCSAVPVRSSSWGRIKSLYR